MKKIVYIYSEYLLEQSNNNPAVKKRASMVHSLIKSYNLLDDLIIKGPTVCSDVDLRVFHGLDYIDCLKSTSDDIFRKSYFAKMNNYDEFGLNYDSPNFPGLYEYTLAIAGGTVSAAEELLLNGADIAVNWFGGWHHAQRDNAAGYCYVNDIVLAILKLRQKYERILYIDLDVHHGDGVETAFCTTKRVFTLSFHQYEPGFYPGSGGVSDCGFGPGLGYSANFPYKSGISGGNFKAYFERVFETIFALYQPKVCVVQCGGDVITGDPLGGANIIPQDIEFCIKLILDENTPVLLLGGGGYNFPNTSRFWTHLTASISNKNLSADIPETEFFLDYGPDYTLNVNRKSIPDENDEEYLDNILEQITNNLKKNQVTSV